MIKEDSENKQKTIKQQKIKLLRGKYGKNRWQDYIYRIT